ncbi:hypothetical protein BKA69DRAFT_668306 [Paraphysoderma sedebokerense]|nr:hypothetical protein BKA69DRAFT_668306 [Paraphysoderma sedebokerense]
MLSVFDILDENGVEFLRSPYGNLAQLSYFVNHPRGYVHAVWCSTDLLMYNVDKVITSIDFERNSFKFIDKQALLNSLQITDEQFLDICLLAGDPNLITTFPPMSSPGEGSQLSFSWANIMDLIRTYGSGFNIAQAWAEHPTVAKSNYIDTFCRTRASVKHHIILSDDGQIEPLNKEYAPSDMHEVIGYRLPDEIYYYLSVGLISPQVAYNL